MRTRTIVTSFGLALALGLAAGGCGQTASVPQAVDASKVPEEPATPPAANTPPGVTGSFDAPKLPGQTAVKPGK